MTPLHPPTPAQLRRPVVGRALLLPFSPLLALAACASPWPAVPAGPGSSSARKRLQQSADHHGLAAWRGLQSVSLAFAGFWSPQGAAVAAAADTVQARWLPHQRVLALGWPTAGGPQQLWRRSPGADLQLWRDRVPVDDPAERQAAALLADLHPLLWLGPMAAADTTAAVNWAEPETLQGLRCDHLHLALMPGLGLGAASADRLSLFVDREQGLLRRLRVSLTGLGTGVPGLAEIDLFDHRRLFGMVWPTRFEARSPGTGTWRLVGLEVNRSFTADDIGGAVWRGAAAGAVRALPVG
ncbi:MAG: hypothetical protein H7242_06665 [Microbacteriaceae bacterium]|nr:hypothetical protein [Burkholderiaceae bacterium]